MRKLTVGVLWFLAATDACSRGGSAQLYAGSAQSEQGSGVTHAAETHRSCSRHPRTIGLSLSVLSYPTVTGLCGL